MFFNPIYTYYLDLSLTWINGTLGSEVNLYRTVAQVWLIVSLKYYETIFHLKTFINVHFSLLHLFFLGPRCHHNCTTNHCWGAGLQNCQTSKYNVYLTVSKICLNSNSSVLRPIMIPRLSQDMLFFALIHHAHIIWYDKF